MQGRWVARMYWRGQLLLGCGQSRLLLRLQQLLLVKWGTPAGSQERRFQWSAADQVWQSGCIPRDTGLNAAHKQPVVDVAQGVWHEGGGLIVPPLAILHTSHAHRLGLLMGCLHACLRRDALRQGMDTASSPHHDELVLVVPAWVSKAHFASSQLARADQRLAAASPGLPHPGGRCTTTAKTAGLPSTGVMGTVSTHLVKEPHKCTCRARGMPGSERQPGMACMQQSVRSQ
jgi:hypothetical protein